MVGGEAVASLRGIQEMDTPAKYRAHGQLSELAGETADKNGTPIIARQQ